MFFRCFQPSENLETPVEKTYIPLVKFSFYFRNCINVFPFKNSCYEHILNQIFSRLWKGGKNLFDLQKKVISKPGLKPVYCSFKKLLNNYIF